MENRTSITIALPISCDALRGKGVIYPMTLAQGLALAANAWSAACGAGRCIEPIAVNAFVTF